jgi:glycosyltransferase involved in cell wall biosynthesis
MSVVLLVSASEADTERLLADGPRRDFLELAAASGAVVRYRKGAARKGLAGRVLGPHIRQAWSQAKATKRGDVIFADGEHLGLPLALLLGLLRRRPARVVMIGHLVSRRWKYPLLWLATRSVRRGTLVLHSVEQQRLVRRWVSGRWRIALVPYQVDTDFWRTTDGPQEPAMLLAVGAENRDYDTLIDAVQGLPVQLVIAGGSHWARRDISTAADIPTNVTVLTEPLGFAALRDLYSEATAVVVPLVDVANQSGVTVLLEAMSMARPVIVTATTGQREVVRGPLVTADGEIGVLEDRGPQHFGAIAGAETGLYVAPGYSDALRMAIEILLAVPQRATAMGERGREVAVRSFSIDAFTAALAALLRPASRTGGAPSPASEPC